MRKSIRLLARERFQKIYELIHEDAVEVKEILFVPRGTVDSVDHVTEENTPMYISVRTKKRCFLSKHLL